MSRYRKQRPRAQIPHELQEKLRDVNERLLISNVHEQESAEASEQERAQLSALLEALSEGVVIADAKGRILMLNDAACKITGIEPVAVHTIDQLIALDIRTLGGAPLPVHECPLRRAMRGEGVVDAEIVLARADGTARHVMTSGTSILDRGEVALALVVFRDVTEVRRLEQQREEYLALISHDIRGPLNAILLVAHSLRGMAEEEGLSERALDRVSRIENNAARITSMVTEILESSRLALGGATVRREPCDLAGSISAVVDGLEDATRARIVFEAAGDAPCVVLADPAQIERAVTNLLTNALKYSRDAVRVRLESREGNAVVEVSDRGVGIELESAPRLFDRYYRAPAGRHIGSGFGLGLYITRLIAEAHGGRVEVQSELGKGSTFSLVIPLHDVQG